MAKPRKSVNGNKVCDTCGEPRSALDYAVSTATTCIECSQAAANAPEVPEVVEESVPFIHNDVELDYSNPTSQELAARTLARRKLIHFIKRFKPKYDAGWVHEDICRRLERFMKDVEDGKEPRLLLNAPVRHGKSEIGSRHFPPFILGHHPDWEIISGAGAQSLATSFSRYIRDLLRDDAYKALFPNTMLDPQSQSVENWNTTSGGGYLAAGVGTMITGRGAHILMIDDPVTDTEAADSQTIRDNVWEWYISTALSRLAPGGGVLVIMTHWNEDDLAGRLKVLSQMDEGGDRFEVVKYPAINDEGDEYILADDTIVQIPPGEPVPEGSRLTRVMNSALHAARYTVKSLLQRKATYYALGQQRWWAALYQQDPSPSDGVYFTKDMFVYFTHLPLLDGRHIYQAWDFAITDKEKSDYNVGATILHDEYGNIFVLDILRFRSDDGIELVQAVVDYARKWGIVERGGVVGMEDGQIWKSLATSFAAACEREQYFPSFEVLVPLTDKGVRAMPLKGLMQQKKVQFAKHATWLVTLTHEFLRFLAGGKHDDIVDAVAWAVRLALLKRPPKPPAPPKSTKKSWKDKVSQYMKKRGSSMSA